MTDSRKRVGYTARGGPQTASVPEARSVSHLLRRQPLHLIVLLILVALVWAFSARVLGDGAFRTVRDIVWFRLSIALVVAHQVVVALIFRLQLGWSTLTRLFGRADMVVWGAIFLPFLVARPVLLAAVGLSDQGSLLLPRPVSLVLAAVLIIPALYTIWSIFRHFGLIRALGADHFRAEYRDKPLVRKGAFAWSANAMYTFAFLLLWSIALLLQSQAALALALFQHAYVWVHYYCTEAPDMDLIYGSRS